MSIAWFIVITFAVVCVQIFVSSNWGLSNIFYTRSFTSKAVFEGEKIEMIDELTNKKLLPVPWLRLESKIDEELKFYNQTDNEVDHSGLHRTLFSLMPYQKVKRRQNLICTKRGYYRFLDSKITIGDAWGFGESFKSIASTNEIIVYPRLLNLEDLPLPAHSWLGDITVRRWIIEDPFLTAGVRDYAAGDPLNAINWKATARTNQLQVTKKDFSADHYLMIYVNFNQTDDIWLPIIDKELIEKALSYAATVATFAISKGVSTGFGCNSYIGKKTSQSIRIEPENSKQQLTYLYETMAKIVVDANKSINFFLKEDLDRKIRGKDILLITSIVTDKMRENIKQLVELGNAIEIMVLDSETIRKRGK